jgi:hypothetical protein
LYEPASFAGASTVKDVSLIIVRLVPKVGPNFANCAVVNPVPVTVTTVPPLTGPLLGKIPETTGAVTELSAAAVILTVTVADPTNKPLVAVILKVSEELITAAFIALLFGSYVYAPVETFTENTPYVPVLLETPAVTVPPLTP